MKPWKLLSLALILPTLSFAADTGDYDGGGGGTLPADPVSVHEIQEFIQRDAKRDLRLFLKYSLWSHQVSHFKSDEKLFGGPRTLWDVMENTDIEVRTDRPCYDNRGKETDASIYADQPNAICFSAARVAPKLPEELVRKEVLALLLHEFSHLLGTTEKEARDYQADVAYRLKKTVRGDGEKFLDGLLIKLSQSDTGFLFLQANFDKLDPAGLRLAFEELNRTYDSNHYLDVDKAMAIFDADDAGYQDLIESQLMLANWYAMAQSGSSDSKYWLDEYNSLFGDKQEITLGELHAKLHHNPNILHGQEKISRINSKADLKAFVEKFGQFLDDVRTHIENLEQNLALPAVPGKPTPKYSPWTQYLGKYAVTKRECVGDMEPTDYTEFAVIPESEGSSRLALRVGTRNSWGNEDLYDGAGDTIGGAVVSISGGDATAVRTSVFGDRWGQRWIKKSWMMMPGPDGYVIVQNYDYRQQYPSNPSAQHLTCRFTLERIAD